VPRSVRPLLVWYDLNMGSTSGDVEHWLPLEGYYTLSLYTKVSLDPENQKQSWQYLSERSFVPLAPPAPAVSNERVAWWGFN
jgi:hypothetical protein